MDNDTCGLELPKAWFEFFWLRVSVPHLASGTGTGFNVVPDVDEPNESRPPAICDECEADRERHADIAHRAYALFATTKAKRSAGRGCRAFERN